MGCMLRSDKMSKYNMYLQPETAFEVLSQLGELSCVQFIDLYPRRQLFQRRFVTQVCRYSDMENKLSNLRKEMEEFEIVPPEQTIPSKAKPLAELEDFENQIQKWQEDMVQLTANEADILKGYLELSEFHYVLRYIGPLLGEAELKRKDLFQKKGGGDMGIGSGGRLIVTTGVVRRTRCMAFETMLWRICRGIIYYRQAEDDKILVDPTSRQEVRKVAFLAICQGEELSSRIQKVCAGFQVSTFPCPSLAKDRKDLEYMLDIRISDLESVLEKTKYIRCRFLRDVAKNYRHWMGIIRKSKAIYSTLNKFHEEMIGECWIPDDDAPKVHQILDDVSEQMESNVPSFMSKLKTDDVPPTYHRTNKFTRGFQNLINAYGDSTYRELNPGLYTLITFPFLFAMMFGDLGHGFILMLFAAWMVLNEKYFMAQRSTNEIWDIMFGGRYVMLLMGLFSMYTGFVYNDLFSRAFSLYDSYYINYFSVAEMGREKHFDLDPTLEGTRKPYMFGEDPVWRLAKNKIMFENSFKMKVSIIVGICHMMFGIILSLFNHTYFRRYYAIFLQFLPELLFLTLIFFWLVVMMFIKWFLYSPKYESDFSTACAPQILILFIDMCLMSKTKPPNEGCNRAYMFDGQRYLQMGLVFTALFCVPVLLFGTPVYKIRQNKKNRILALKRLRDYKKREDRDEKFELKLADQVDKCTVSFPELMIHQGVHTIEFVLSTISHTASYLRLWALSLAHSQLSEMLWNMILAKLGLRMYNIVGAFVLIPIFFLWAIFTVAILVVMEGLSAFLHCLRLHWVEFMSKFYGGTGWPFRPFSFQEILDGEPSKADSGCKKYNIWPINV